MAPIVESETTSNSVWEFINKYKLAFATVGIVAVGTAGYLIYSTQTQTIESTGKSKKNQKKKNKKKKKSKNIPVDEKGFPNLTEEFKKSLSDEDKETFSVSLKEDGNTAFKNKDFEKAIAFYTGAIEIKPNEIFYSNRSACFASLEQFDKVIEDTTTALKIKPDYSKCLLRRATAYEKLGQYEDAMFDLTALTLYGGYSQDMVNKSLEKNLRLLSEKVVAKQEKSVVPSLPSAVYITSFFSGFQPDNKIIENLKSDESLEKGSGEFFLLKALEDLSKSTAEAYELFDSDINQSILKFKDEFINENNKSLAAIAFEYAGVVSFLKHSDEDAKKFIEKSLELKPRSRAYIMKGLIFSDSQDIDSYMPFFDKAEELDANNGDIYYQRGQMYFLSNNYDEAKKNFIKAKELNPNSIYANIQLACMEHSNGNEQESERLFTEARKKFPLSPEIPNYHGEILLSKQKFDEAIEEFDIAYRLQKASGKVTVGVMPLIHKAGIYILKQDIAKASELYEKAIEEDYKSEEAKSGLAQVRLQEEKVDEAIQLFEEAAKLCRNHEAKVNATSYAEAAKMQIRISKDAVLKKKVDEMVAAYQRT